MASSSSSCSKSWKFDVFLNFRGEDTRKTFVDHLYYAFQQHGILTYKDDITLARGDTITPSLMKAIESSQILVIIFSENYADSSWCLDELSHIIKCKNSQTGQIVMPIFYHVDPSDVRKQKGKYGEIFAKHELSEISKNKVETWKKTLFEASNIAGWESKHVSNGHEGKCIQEIVDTILSKLSSLQPVVEDEELVGMGTRLKDLKSKLRLGSGGVHMVGIWGIGGGGKTTLATSLYMEISSLFDACCFLDNIRVESGQQNGLKHLQEKLLSAIFSTKMQIENVDIGKHTIKRMLRGRNVLIVLDDVDHLDQLKALAGCHAWFGDRSRIIITTRDQHLLIFQKVDEVCPVNLLSRDEAIRLFKMYAYHEINPVEDYEKLSLLFISYVDGLPLAIKILGSFLCGRDKNEWLNTLARLKDHPEMDIVQKLKISYDGLKDVEKELFLDIACFYRGKMEDEAMEILDACGFYPQIGVKLLIQKALITVSKGGYFDMHDLVQEMGHYIVRGKYPNNPEKHSRVWRDEDINGISSKYATTVNDKIQGIRFEFYPSNFIKLISNMKKLRFLKVTNTSFDKGPSFLSNELRYLYWETYSASAFPESFQPTKLAILKINGTLQKELWKGYQCLPCLKELKLVGARKLVRTPDFGGLPCLQKLILGECESLTEIHQSLGNHNSLVHIFLRNCGNLKRFPRIVRMEKLKILQISGGRALVEFPKIEAKMDSLVALSLYEVGIEVLPSSVGEYCTNLISLSLIICGKLKRIEGNFHALKCLEKFLLRGCTQLKELPKDLFNGNLDKLCLDLYYLSSSTKKLILSHLPRYLRKLDLSNCYLKDEEVPSELGQLSGLQELDLSWNYMIKRLNFSLSRLTSLKLLQLNSCWGLVELPELPPSLAIFNANYCRFEYTDDNHINYKWLCQVSIHGLGRSNIGIERLIETMFQGNLVESGCMHVDLQGYVLRVLEPRLFRWERCRMQLPENWYNDFSGFLFFTFFYDYHCPEITIKHEKLDGGSTGMEDSQDNSGVDFPEHIDYARTRLMYISFGSLRNTLWWQDHQTSTSMDVQFDPHNCNVCGYKLIPKRSETSITDSSSSSSFDDVYTCRLNILEDSKSALKFNVAVIQDDVTFYPK